VPPLLICSNIACAAATVVVIAGAVAGVLVIAAAAGGFVCWKRQSQEASKSATATPTGSTEQSRADSLAFAVSNPIAMAHRASTGPGKV
jgi:hypothetical protein